MTTALEIRRHASLDDVADGAWDELAARSLIATIFQTKPWHAAWIATFATDAELLLFGAYRQATLVGLAAFSLDTAGVLRPIGNGRSDYADVLCSAEEEEARTRLLRAVFAAARWKRLEWRYLPSASPTHSVLRSLGIRTLTIQEVPCPTLRIADPETDLGKVANKKSLRRHHNWFLRQAGARVDHWSSATDILPHLESFFAQHETRWAQTEHPSLFLAPANRDFYRSVVQHFDGTDRLCLTRLAIDDQPVAFHFGFVFGGVFTWYKPTFAIDLARHSPGEALLRELFLLTQREGFVEFDFAVGDEAFKNRFTNHVRYVEELRGFRHAFDYRLQRSLGTARQLAKAVLRRG